MRLLLATIILHFDIELCDESQNWRQQKAYTLWEKSPLWCKLHQVRGKEGNDKGVNCL